MHILLHCDCAKPIEIRDHIRSEKQYRPDNREMHRIVEKYGNQSRRISVVQSEERTNCLK